MLNLVQEFFRGYSLPKSITHAKFVLLPKNEHIQSFTDLTSVILNNFINKIILKIVQERIEEYFSKLIQHNQSDFVKDKSIIKNVLLTQENVSDIRKMGEKTNVVLKLDMSKTYDRVSWFFPDASALEDEFVRYICGFDLKIIVL